MLFFILLYFTNFGNLLIFPIFPPDSSLKSKETFYPLLFQIFLQVLVGKIVFLFLDNLFSP